MPQLARKYTDRLEDLKKDVDAWQSYNQANVDRFHQFRRFVFDTSLTGQDIAVLNEQGTPTLEFNILEAYISSLRGEFAKQQPSIQVRAADGIPPQMIDETFVEQRRVVEAHLKAIFFDAQNDKMEYDIYTDLLSGGFSAARVYTDYVSEKSFEQSIRVERLLDPTLGGWDVMATESHKGDGRFCYVLYPMAKADFEERFGKERTKDISFTRSLNGFSWSYRDGKEDFIMVCEYYGKVRKREKILQLTNGYTVLEREYKQFLTRWEEEKFIEQPPIPYNERYTSIESIERYTFCETCVLEHDDTNYRHLPIVYFGGNNIMLTQGNSAYEMSRPYVYHAKGIQQLKNYAGQSLAKELESTVQHKFIVAEESIPENYLTAYENPQRADTLVYKHFQDENNPEVTLPPPREVNRTPIPPQISDTFRLSDEMTTVILGSYNQASAMNRADLSGVAIARNAIQGNNASVPYLIGYIKGINRIAQIIVDLIPKYYRTPRSLPVLLPSGKREYEEINKKGSVFMNYDPAAMQVKVDTGVNFAMQKELALQTISQWMQASPAFAEFINTSGLQIILDNIDIRGVDELKLKAEQYEQKREQMQQQAMQAQQGQMQAQAQQAQRQQQTDDAELETKRLINEQIKKDIQAPTREEVEMMKLQEKSTVDRANLALKQREQNTKFMEVLAKVRNDAVDRELKIDTIDAENARTLIEALDAPGEER